MNFELIIKIITRQGFYVLSDQTLHEIKHGINEPGNLVFPTEKKFVEGLNKYGLMVTRTSDPKIFLIKNK